MENSREWLNKYLVYIYPVMYSNLVSSLQIIIINV